MELVGMLRVLWRHRLLVVVAALIAVLVGLGVAYRIGFPAKLESRRYDVGLGTVTALVDTPSSQIVDLGGKTGADIGTLAARAQLLASLMTSSPIKDEIASRAGVAPDKLIALSAAGALPGAPPSGGASISQSSPKANILTARIPNLESGDVPIIAVTTQAPVPPPRRGWPMSRSPCSRSTCRRWPASTRSPMPAAWSSASSVRRGPRPSREGRRG